VSPIGPLHRGPGEVNYPVSVGGIVVHPGDLVVGDDNGVVVVPRESCAELLNRLRAQSEAEAAYLEAVQAGRFSNDWVDETLKSGGAIMDGDIAPQ
jgi:regulator of RNase E activity RraA